MGALKLGTRPEIGMGVTIYSNPVTLAGTIVGIAPSGDAILFQYDRAIHIKMNSDLKHQYKFQRNLGSPLWVACQNDDGIWRIQDDGRVVGLGFRHYYIGLVLLKGGL